jgi:DNA-binding IscR family transcriptional regulator
MTRRIADCILLPPQLVAGDASYAAGTRQDILAIAAVIDGAIHDPRGRPLSAKTLATRHKLSPRHLKPVLQALVRDGILKGLRQPHGGYELARGRKRITAEDILSTPAALRRAASRRCRHRR